MTAKLTTQAHYVLPESPHAGTIRTFDVIRSGSLLSDGRIEWIPMGVSQKATRLPEEVKLGDVSHMVTALLRRGWLITPAVPKNELWEMFKTGMIGPTMDLVAPGLNVLVSSAIHGGIETASEGKEQAKYFNRSLGGYFSLPYLDVLEIDWREMGSFWSLSLQGPVRHLTIVYRESDGQRATLTLVGSFTFKNWVQILLRGRYNEEIRAEQNAVIDSLMDPAAQTEFLAGLASRAGSDASPQAADAMLREFGEFRTKYLLEHGITEEIVAAKTREQARSVLERYRGLPEADDFINVLQA